MNNGEELTTEQQKNRIYDYIFLCFFLGNDFMPHFPSVNIRTGGVDKMLNAYKATIGGTNENLTDGKKIFWKNVRKLVQNLANSEEEFIKVSKKHNKKNLPIVHSLEEFIECIKEKKKPNVDFIIHDTAHCSHTFEGTLCKDVRRCKKIHIQRCIVGEKCKNKNCPYLHIFDMPDNESKKSFSETMSLYNKIKPKKQVKSIN
jgi:5'-3' exonuclease